MGERQKRRNWWFAVDAPGLDLYERQALPATSLLDSLYAQLVGELDQENGAFAWWSGHSDWKTLTMLADYLLQSILGSSEALVAASFAAQEHREQTYAETDAAKRLWREFVKAGQKNSRRFAEAHTSSDRTRRRTQRIIQSAESCFFHLMQTLDRLAVAVIIVGGFEVDVSGDVYWTTLESIATEAHSQKPKASVLGKGRVEPLGTAGRDLQLKLLTAVKDWQSFGETDWLTWLRHTRNAMTHRSPAKRLNVIIDDQMVWPFYKQPKWSELQSLVFGVGETGTSMLDAFIMRSSVDVLDGLCASTTKVVVALTEAMKSCWEARRSDPATIIQQGKQWPTIEPTKSALAFPEYGKALTPPVDGHGHTNDLDGIRWTAARVDDSRRRDWYK
ncbi:hypothetical protein Mycsm_04313 [Mycobacterium sp. JS623]|nr:hypothetical protein Mycsm_04313 [Mycobacterium sp. JS623]